jgi:hypothetical protein
MGLEGIVLKRLTAPYRSGPSRDWLKGLAQGEEPGQPGDDPGARSEVVIGLSSMPQIRGM